MKKSFERIQVFDKIPPIPPILSTGGYHDTFLKFIGNVFNSKIVKCHEYLKFVTTAIDYLN